LNVNELRPRRPRKVSVAFRSVSVHRVPVLFVVRQRPRSLRPRTRCVITTVTVAFSDSVMLSFVPLLRLNEEELKPTPESDGVVTVGVTGGVTGGVGGVGGVGGFGGVGGVTGGPTMALTTLPGTSLETVNARPLLSGGVTVVDENDPDWVPKYRRKRTSSPVCAEAA
jgi:hypothetical protein